MDLKWLESIVRCSLCSERIFCWFGINYFPCQSRTLQPSASLPSCNFFASLLEPEPFHLTSACSCSATSSHHTHGDQNFLSLVRRMRLIMGGWTCQNYALNSGYALNNDMRLTTGFYGILISMLQLLINKLVKI